MPFSRQGALARPRRDCREPGRSHAALDSPACEKLAEMNRTCLPCAPLASCLGCLGPPRYTAPGLVGDTGHMKPRSPNERAEALEEIAAMISRLDELREREPDPTIASAYRAAIDRLEGSPIASRDAPGPRSMASSRSSRPSARLLPRRNRFQFRLLLQLETRLRLQPQRRSGRSSSLPLGPVVVQTGRSKRR